MRGLINAFGGWFDSGQDTFDGAIRLVVGFGAILLLTIAIFALFFLGLSALLGSAPPSLFCQSGTQVHSEPATQIVGKVPVSGVRFTCQWGPHDRRPR